MSTRANIIVTDGDEELIFYRHSDGYPEGARPLLDKFLGHVKAGHIRDNVGQAAGWLIVLGREEYAHRDEPQDEYNAAYRQPEPTVGTNGSCMSWKVGSIEPATGIHGDIEWLYIVDLKAKTIRQHECGFNVNGPEFPAKFYSGKFATVAA